MRIAQDARTQHVRDLADIESLVRSPALTVISALMLVGASVATIVLYSSPSAVVTISGWFLVGALVNATAAWVLRAIALYAELDRRQRRLAVIALSNWALGAGGGGDLGAGSLLEPRSTGLRARSHRGADRDPHRSQHPRSLSSVDVGSVERRRAFAARELRPSGPLGFSS
jgi:hypothetical protein